MRLPLVAASVLLAINVATVRAQGFAPVDAAINSGIARHVYPGAVLVVGRADTILYAHGYGHFTWSAASPVPNPSTTRWDMASLTKIVATTASMARLVQEHRVDLDAPVVKYLPEFVGGRKGEVTVRMLLNHTSGMPPYAPLFKTAHSPAEARRQLFAVPLRRAPGASAVYSDLNAMLAGFVIAAVTGQPLDQFAETAVFTPLGMTSTHFRPTGIDKAQAAPTGQYHGHPVGGVVNDQNAVVFGGVSGHAGLFSTGADLSRFMQAWLNAGKGKSDWLKRATVAEFLTRSPTSDTRVLGWDTPVPPNSPKPSLFGRCATTSTFGHTGWTGTELWFDPSADLFVVLLTNRSFAPADPKGSFLQLKDVRANVADAVRRAAGRCG
ncbi:MAG TPA: serine hydrolase domain-containing protein [Gemmatimonadales bacterium]|jgi:CubicO group peptidase (beta-lactamase class C family)